MEKIKVIHVITRFDKGGAAENTFLLLQDLDKGLKEAILRRDRSKEGISLFRL
jgi:hypothetical protein